MTAPMYVPRFLVRQKITMMVNRYQVVEEAADGGEGRLLAFAGHRARHPVGLARRRRHGRRAGRPPVPLTRGV